MEETEPVSIGFNKRRAEGRDKTDLTRKNLQLKVRRLNPANTISYVQILGTGMDTQDTSPSVLLFFDKQRFIFNAGEGLQRFCTEHRIKLSKIDHIFLSRVCSETAGGLPGLLLTLAGIGDAGMSVNVWGPSDFKYLVDAMKSFIPYAAMVHTRSFGPALGFDVDAAHESSKSHDPIVLVDDEVVKISAILVHPSSNREFQPQSERSSTTNVSSTVKLGDMSVVYVCELPEIKGKFDPSKAAAFGLLRGPKYRELQLGNSVMSDTQNLMVNPSDVLGPSVPGPVVLLVDCPTESHLLELMSLQSLRSYYEDFSRDKTETGTVACVIHLSPTSILGSPNYQKWMERFGSAQHIMAGHDRKNVAIPILRSSARISARLNHLCPQLFPAPGFWSHQQLNFQGSDSCSSSEIEVSSQCKSILAENLLKFTLRPYAHLGLDRSGIPSQLSLSETINELHSDIPEILDAVQNVSQLWRGSAGSSDEKTPIEDDNAMIEESCFDENNVPSCLENIRRDDLEIVLLGTGSSQPSKYRNVSSIYINLFAKGSMLLDCGEGTLGQLKRRYGVEGGDAAVRNLRCIWISHIHADHHTGLARILAVRRDLLREVPHEPVLVIGPRQLERYLDAYQRLEDLDMQFLDCKHTTQSSLDAFQNVLPEVDINNAAMPLLKCLNKVLSKAGLEALISFPVVHCPQAFGVVLKAAERANLDGKLIPGWKIVYSGDTRPCPELMEATRGATLLIHEATFEDSLVEEAIAKNHSTTSEAIDIGNSAGAYRIILTHFSQRYPKIPVVEERYMHKTCIAFDLMSVNVADLLVLPKVVPYLKLLFRNEMIVEESEDVVTES